MQVETKKKMTPNNNEIDLYELALSIWSERLLVIKTIVVFITLGLIIAFGTTKEYKSEAKLLPEITGDKGGASSLLKQFGGLGSLVGIDFGSGSLDAISPRLYPHVIKSVPFLLHIMETEVSIPSMDTIVTVEEYMNELKKTSLVGIIKKFTIGLPRTILNLYRNKEEVIIPQQKSDILQVTREQFLLIEILRERISANLDESNGVITISAEFPDPLMSAQIAEQTIEYLTQYITEYRTNKASKNLAFINELYENAKIDYISAQQNLAIFRDNNKNVISELVNSEEIRYQAEYDLAYNLYNGLAQQLEQAKIKVQEETPVLSILNPVQVPNIHSKPRKAIILIVMVFIGGIIGLLVVYIKYFIKNVRNRMLN